MIAITTRDKADTELLEGEDDVLNEKSPIKGKQYNLMSYWK